ncbi:aspartic protease [Gymnopilus junonius]|uniref:Aspartic protease n=1 Tax=Gymnopilus junonius TaxID=109634 RepID=A0A9P5NSA7_GYMJU|nr:aspartic protease [Gymnopilus junonius]
MRFVIAEPFIRGHDTVRPGTAPYSWTMFSKAILVTSLAISVVADPVLVNRSPIRLPLSRRHNFTSVHNLVRHDQNRAKSLRLAGTAEAAGLLLERTSPVNSQVDNQAVAYVASVGIGSPAATYELLVDTGSSLLCVGENQVYKRTVTSTATSTVVSGTCAGNEFIDQVTIAPGLVIPKQDIVVVSTPNPSEGVDGTLGLGPADLTTVGIGSATIPTVTDSLFAIGDIPADSIAISFQPTTTEESLNGEITWGGTDSSKFTGTITFTYETFSSCPITATSPSSSFWGINQSIRYGSSTSILAATAGIVDTGTTLLLIASDGFSKYKSASGAVLDNSTGLLRITSAQFSNLQSLFFTIEGTTFQFTPNAQIWPRSLNVDIGGASGSIYLIVGDFGTNSGEGLDFINGLVFLERFYSVLDTANKRVGFATTPFTTATTN